MILVKKSSSNSDIYLPNNPFIPELNEDSNGELFCNLRSYMKNITLPFDEFITQYEFIEVQSNSLYTKGNDMFSIKRFDESLMVVEVTNVNTGEDYITSLIDFFSNYRQPTFQR